MLVLSEALVTPSSTVSAVAGSPPSARTWLLISSNSKRSTSSNGSCSRVAGLVDAHLAQHLANDDLDVLVVDGHALAAVHALDLLDQVALDRIPTAGLEVLLRVDRAVGDRVAGTDLLAVLDQQLGVVRDGVLALDDVLAGERAGPRRCLTIRPRSGARTSSHRRRPRLDGGRRPGWPRPGPLRRRAPRGPCRSRSGMSNSSRLVTFTRRRAVLALDDLDDAVDVADLGLALGHAGLEQLLDARQTGGDVQAGDAAGVERAHGQLRAGLADGLGGDDADRLADADQLAGGQVAPVARAADAVARLAGERRAHERPRRRRPRRWRSASSSVISWLRSTMRLASFFLRARDPSTGPAAKRPTRRIGNASASGPRTPRSRRG